MGVGGQVVDPKIPAFFWPTGGPAVTLGVCVRESRHPCDPLMKITGLDLHVLLVPDYDAGARSSAQDDLVVEVHTDEGITGVGETDTNPWVARECIRARGTHCMGRGLLEMLLGADPLRPEADWE